MRLEKRCVDRKRTRRIVLLGFAAAVLLTLASCARTSTVKPLANDNEWHEFEGTWTAAGNRSSISLGAERRASIGSFDGSLLLNGAGRPAIGFRSDAIVMNDTATGMVGRAVWTDERGDQVYSELKGQGTAAGNKIVGTFIGGSGRYAGATGTYEFSWRFVLENEDGTVQGQSSGLKGRVRVEPPPQTPSTGGARP